MAKGDIVGFPQGYTDCMSLFGEIDERKYEWIPDPKETSIRVLDELKRKRYGWLFGRGPARWLSKEPQAGAFEISFEGQGEIFGFGSAEI